MATTTQQERVKTVWSVKLRIHIMAVVIATIRQNAAISCVIPTLTTV